MNNKIASGEQNGMEFTDKQITLDLPILNSQESNNGTNQKSISLSTRWLRDRCLCSECFQRQQRSLLRVETGFKPIKESIASVTKNADNNKIDVTWTDGHSSCYDLTYLASHIKQTMPRPDITKRFLWDVDSLKKNGGPIELVFSDVMNNVETQRKLIEGIQRFGFVSIVDSPTEKSSLCDLLNLLGGSMTSLFSEAEDPTQVLTNNNLENSLGWTNNRVPGHTDLTFYHNPSGLVGLHLLQHDGTGGDLAIMDAFQIAERMRIEQPKLFQHMLNTPVLWKYISAKDVEKLVTNILRLDPGTQECLHFKWTPLYIYPLHGSSVEETDGLYDTLAYLYNEIQINPANRFVFTPRPGQIILFDNWRMVHERATPFTGTRLMHVGDITRDNWTATARKFGVL